MGRVISDSFTMFQRCLTKTMRSPEQMTMAFVVPIVMMVLFGLVFGGVAEVEGFSYINFIVPGILVQCIGNASGHTSLAIHNDMSKGLIDRFRSMQIAKSAFMAGHVWVSVLRCTVITIVAFGISLPMGMRPSASFVEWLMIIGILIMFIIAVTWIFVITGLVAKDAESINGTTMLVVLFTFFSSAFAPIETLPAALRVFARHQPMTPVIDAVRSLMLGLPRENEVLIALLWCAGISIVSFVIAVQIYKSKMTK